MSVLLLATRYRIYRKHNHKGHLGLKVREKVYPHDNIHEINTPKCPIQTQCGEVIYSSVVLNIA